MTESAVSSPALSPRRSGSLPASGSNAVLGINDANYKSWMENAGPDPYLQRLCTK